VCILYAPGLPNQLLATMGWAARATARVDATENLISDACVCVCVDEEDQI
jgi:hypothetical protein